MCRSVFFFKQKTAYEMRISDWSSGVCSSDLASPAGSCVELAAVDVQHLAGDRAGQVAGEEERGLGDLVGRGQPLEVGRLGLLAIDVLVGASRLRGQPVEVGLVDVLIDVGRGHAVHPDAARSQLGGPGGGQVRAGRSEERRGGKEWVK